MAHVLVDTDVISYLIKGDTRGEAYQRLATQDNLAISFVTLAELQHWAMVRGWNQRKRNKIEDYLSAYFKIYYCDSFLCQKWAEVVYHSRQLGKPIQPNDAWIAATALLWSLTLVTHNLKDYQSVKDLKLLDIQEF